MKIPEPPIFYLPNDNPDLQEAANALLDIAPCPVEVIIPDYEPHRCKSSRSAYFKRGKGRWARTRDWIYLKEGGTVGTPVKGWVGLYVLAHEIGHALDYHKVHPAQFYLKGPRCRYRNELAAASFAQGAMYYMGKNNLKTVRRWITLDTSYVNSYVKSNNMFGLIFMQQKVQETFEAWNPLS